MLRKKRIEKTIFLGVRPEHTSFEQIMFDAYPDAKIDGVLQFDEFVGSDHYYHLSSHGKETFSVRSHPRYRYEEGEKMSITVDMDKALFFDRDTEKLLTD